MDITDYHAKYFANELTRRGNSGVERISQSLFDASVDLNPHQIDAALFALRTPLSKGVLLADEVGLGKTIEAIEKEYLKYVSMRCWIDPAEVGELAVFLASTRARHVSGQYIAVDGHMEWES